MTEEEIYDLLLEETKDLSASEGNLWDAISIIPERWRLSPWADEEGGFWVVALFGMNVIYYNAIEDGFNSSSYLRHGKIEEYWCNQDGLKECLTKSRDLLVNGYQIVGKAGPPRAIDEN